MEFFETQKFEIYKIQFIDTFFDFWPSLGVISKKLLLNPSSLIPTAFPPKSLIALTYI